jgi:hypothetical protein
VQKCQIKISKKKFFRVAPTLFGTRPAFTPAPLRGKKHPYISTRYNTKTTHTARKPLQKHLKINPFDKMSANRLFCFLFVNHSPLFSCKMLLVCAFPCQNVTLCPTVAGWLCRLCQVVPVPPAFLGCAASTKKKCVFSAKSLLLFCSVKKKYYICVGFERATLNARKLSRATRQPREWRKIERL